MALGKGHLDVTLTRHLGAAGDAGQDVRLLKTWILA